MSAADLVAAIASLTTPLTPTPSKTPSVPPSDTPTLPPSQTPSLTTTPSTTATATPSSSPTPPAPSPTAKPLNPAIAFTDVTNDAGLNYSDGAALRGNVAAGDYDGDGWTDVYMVRRQMGPSRPNPLFHNRGDGTFEEVANSPGMLGTGATFADIDGDGRLDLYISGISGSSPQLYRNVGGGSFMDVTAKAGFAIDYEADENRSAAFGDYDRDGYLDLFMTHWGSPISPGRTIENLWHNNGDMTFSGVTNHASLQGLTSVVLGRPESSWMYTPNFADINNDGWPDLLVAADFATSRVYLNNHDGTFTDATNQVISDENGMGAAVGDYDNDGNLDWFVSSIWDPVDEPELPYLGVTGNRLYRGHGDGTFDDVTDAAGVREGWWGWGSCFADFNNDGNLDIFHVNGQLHYVPLFVTDPSRLFISNGDGTFTERSHELGMDDHGPGLGVVCFDYDGDGDIDILVANDSQSARLYRNDGGNQNAFLDVKLSGRAPNTEAIGARVYATSGGQTQMRELRAGSNFASQDPVVAHFGLSDATVVDSVRVVWPDQTSTTMTNVTARQHLVIVQP
ncbi:MAG: CRTAC1 family protein [Deltaproteobacteria bacterium]|nr:CRTAC1 family protein [Deltaproteobacteria bacterium]